MSHAGVVCQRCAVTETMWGALTIEKVIAEVKASAHDCGESAPTAIHVVAAVRDAAVRLAFGGSRIHGAEGRAPAILAVAEGHLRPLRGLLGLLRHPGAGDETEESALVLLAVIDQQTGSVCDRGFASAVPDLRELGEPISIQDLP